ncbi:HNH endonuclease signature motif containing protein, partial [Galactobacter sp.]|uniref:HNH endonuclease signature motif containing protein n=1 Tax=Galactobacter sp. TaxID=2676125 RepID=UPI0025C2BAF0
WARATKGVPDEFLKTHHIGCGGQPGQPRTQTPEVSADGNAAGESCTPTTGFTDVESVGDLFSHLVPGEAAEDEGVAGDVWVPAGMEYDSTLGLLLPAGVGVHVNLVITDLAAFGITDQPAQIFGLGPYPAEMARELIHTAQTRHSATMRRLYTEPGSGALMRMESTARTFPDGLGTMLALRDGHCRFPFCDAPIRHLDHIQPHAEGGPTSYSNGQGLCARHNLIKESDGATTNPASGGDTGSLGAGAIITVLSTGMKFTSPARAFPTESPMTVAEDHYWRGYRDGRGDQRQQQTDREHDLQNQEDTIFAAEDHLKQMAHALLEHGTA